MIFDLDAFHVLAANVQDTVYFRVKKGSSIIVRNRFDFAVV